jgi:hypothetical protein
VLRAFNKTSRLGQGHAAAKGTYAFPMYKYKDVWRIYVFILRALIGQDLVRSWYDINSDYAFATSFGFPHRLEREGNSVHTAEEVDATLTACTAFSPETRKTTYASTSLRPSPQLDLLPQMVQGLHYTLRKNTGRDFS